MHESRGVLRHALSPFVPTKVGTQSVRRRVWSLELAPLTGLARETARRRPRMGPWLRGRDGSFVPFARLHFLPGMRQGADGAGEHEQAAAERRRKAQFSIDDAGRAVDVERDPPLLLCRERILRCPRDGGEAPADDAFGRRRIDQSEKARRARVERMEAVAEAGNMAYPAFSERAHFCRHRLSETRPAWRGLTGQARRDRIVERHALLAGAAVHVAEH